LFEFTKKFFDKLKKISLIPSKLKKLLSNKTKDKAKNIVKKFSQGILNNTLELASLKKRTIRKKVRMGFEKPETPLFGLGDKSKESYANMMEVVKIKNGYKVKPKNKLHHSKKITLKKLFFAHEDAKRNHTPKRPALQIVLSKIKDKYIDINIDSKTLEVKVEKK